MEEVERSLRTVRKAVGVQAGHSAGLPTRRNVRRITRPNRRLAMGHICYEKSVKEWEVKEEDQAHGR